jgi:AcrR family transcriptional regulator
VEAAASELGGSRELSRDKATRIVEAMRVSVAARGVAGSTFDHVARTAGVSRGLLHYYFGTKESLLVEVVRREAEVRIARLDDSMADARNADDVLDALVHTFEDFLGEGPATPVMVYELISLAQRNPEIAAELAELSRRTRCHLADLLKDKDEAGVVELRADADTVAAFLFAIADGLTMRRMSEADYDISPVVDQGVAAARSLLR